jgi:hypothetical protein
MSHLATIKTEIKDIAALKAACKELGLQFNEGATTHRIWCDNPKIWATQEAPCAHSITSDKWKMVGGLQLDIGLIKTETGYTMSMDNMLESEGYFRGSSIGEGACKLLQFYGVNKATIEARKQGWIVQRKAGADGAIKLVCHGM